MPRRQSVANFSRSKCFQKSRWSASRSRRRLLRRRGWQRSLAATATLVGLGLWLAANAAPGIVVGALAAARLSFVDQLPLVMQWPSLGRLVSALATAETWLLPITFLAMAIGLARIERRGARL